jgi:hypothetical protein
MQERGSVTDLLFVSAPKIPNYQRNPATVVAAYRTFIAFIDRVLILQEQRGAQKEAGQVASPIISVFYKLISAAHKLDRA